MVMVFRGKIYSFSLTRFVDVAGGSGVEYMKFSVHKISSEDMPWQKIVIVIGIALKNWQVLEHILI